MSAANDIPDDMLERLVRRVKRSHVGTDKAGLRNNWVNRHGRPALPVPLRHMDTESKSHLGYSYARGFTPKHIRIIGLHLSGHRNVDIAEHLGCSTPLVTRVLNHPKAQPLIEEGYRSINKELRGLMPLAVDTLSKGMQDSDLRIALKASDQYFKTQQKYAPKESEKTTAEDVIQRVLSIKRGDTTITMSETRKEES